MPTQNCPYCGILFSLEGVDFDIQFPKFGRSALRREFASPLPPMEDSNYPKTSKSYRITSHYCPSCKKEVMWLTELLHTQSDADKDWDVQEGETFLLFPKRRQKVISADIPEPYATEFLESFYSLDVSPKASAALSRRCLQLLIREQEKIEERTLLQEVSKLIATNKLPKHLAEELDAIRNIGNFAAHPSKDTNTDAIVPVEQSEAEWTLGILEQLLCFYFVELPASKACRDALNMKLKNSGQKPML